MLNGGLMKKYLIICNFYLPNATANGVCVSAIAEQLVKEGKEVHVLSLNNTQGGSKENINGVHVNRIHQGFRNSLISFSDTHKQSVFSSVSFKMAMMINKVIKLILIPLFPLSSLTLPIRFYIKARKIIKKENVSVIVSVHDPLETNISAYFLKKKMPSLKWCFYMLDSISNGAKPAFMSQKQFSDKGLWWERKFFSKADLILNLVGNRTHYSSPVYDEYLDKIRYTDIPLLNLENFKEISNFDLDHESILITYAGALTTHLRNPEYACRCLLEVSLVVKLKVDFYSRGNCDSIIKNYEKKGDFKLNDYIPHALLHEKLSQSDVLLSIGNRYSEMVPSKTFEYISYGKKIIHFYNSESDPSLKYFVNYENALLINENDDFKDNVKSVIKFLSSNLILLSKDKLKEIFTENLPSHTTEMIDGI